MKQTPGIPRHAHHGHGLSQARILSKKRGSPEDEKEHPEVYYWRESAKLAMVRSSTPGLWHPSLTPEEHLAAVYFKKVSMLQLDKTWFGIVPPRIGTSKAVDLATKALTSLGTRSDILSDAACRRSYLAALCALRDVISTPPGNSDHALLAVALLAPLEININNSMAPVFSHMQGMTAILLSRPPSAKPSELTRAIVYGYYSVLFENPLNKGIPSPFDSPHFLDMEPPTSPVVLPPHIMDLQRATHKLLLRLPRLIAVARQLRENSDDHSSTAKDYAIRLAQELLAIQNTKAESEILHRISVNKSTDMRNAMTAMSFSFGSISVFKIAIFYWHARIFVLRICRRLQLNTPPLEPEVSRMCKNVLMSAEFAKQCVYGGQYMNHAIVAVWGALGDFEETFSVMAGKTRRGLLVLTNILVSKALTERDLDLTAEMYVGGPLLVDGRRDGVTSGRTNCIPTPPASPAPQESPKSAPGLSFWSSMKQATAAVLLPPQT